MKPSGNSTRASGVPFSDAVSRCCSAIMYSSSSPRRFSCFCCRASSRRSSASIPSPSRLKLGIGSGSGSGSVKNVGPAAGGTTPFIICRLLASELSSDARKASVSARPTPWHRHVCQQLHGGVRVGRAGGSPGPASAGADGVGGWAAGCGLLEARPKSARGSNSCTTGAVGTGAAAGAVAGGSPPFAPALTMLASRRADSCALVGTAAKTSRLAASELSREARKLSVSSTDLLGAPVVRPLAEAGRSTLMYGSGPAAVSIAATGGSCRRLTCNEWLSSRGDWRALLGLPALPTLATLASGGRDPFFEGSAPVGALQTASAPDNICMRALADSGRLSFADAGRRDDDRGRPTEACELGRVLATCIGAAGLYRGRRSRRKFARCPSGWRSQHHGKVIIGPIKGVVVPLALFRLARCKRLTWYSCMNIVLIISPLPTSPCSS